METLAPPVERPAPSRRPSRIGPGVAVAGGFVALVGLYLAAGRAVTPNSDGASLVLEGQAVGRGHLLLQGWALSLDSFWTSEVPLYAVGYVARGVDPLLLRLVPAVLAALVVVLGALVAQDGARRGAAAVGALTLVALLGFPTRDLTMFFLRGGSHIGALGCSLLAFYAVRRARWGFGAVVAALSLTVGMLGDLETLAYGTAPLLLAGLVAARRTRSWRSGAVPCGTAAAAVAATLAIRVVTGALGAFAIGPANPIVRNPLHLVRNVGTLLRFGDGLLGPSTAAFGPGSTPAALQAVHAVGAVVAVAGVLAAAVRLAAGLLGRGTRDRTSPGRHRAERETWWQAAPSSWRLDDVLVAAVVTSAGSFVLLTTSDEVAYGRYLTASVVFACVLGGRLAVRVWSRPLRPATRRVLASAGLIVALCFAAGFGYRVSAPAAPRPAQGLVAWLEARHLTSGVGAYWSASITTVESHDRVRVRPVVAGPAGRLVRYDRESAASWYTGARFDFLVYQPGAPWNDVDGRTATSTWGVPTRAYAVDGYAVLVWARPFTVAARGGASS